MSFFDTEVSDGKLTIRANKCCDASHDNTLARKLLAKGVIVSVSVGGDGCQKGPPEGLDTLSSEALLEGFEKLRTETGVNWSGIDFDWEGDDH
jgi:hypothetical protein